MDFSIIIPAKNEEANIVNCLDSIRAMKFDQARYEVLVVDNGSFDRTAELARDKGARVFHEPELTIAGLRNFGAAQANGKILAFLDADCTVDESWLETACVYLERPDVVSFGSPAILPPDAVWVQKAWFKIREKKHQVEEVEWHESANVFVQKEAFHAVRGFNEKLITCEDYDLSIRLKRLGKLLSDTRVIAVHHREPATIEEFFFKELWRGKSNFNGTVSHGFRWKEMPSLVVPLAYCLLAGFVFCLLVLGLLFSSVPILIFWILLFFWQVPLGLLAWWKVRRDWSLIALAQLIVLLNLYFAARGLAVFGKGQR